MTPHAKQEIYQGGLWYAYDGKEFTIQESPKVPLDEILIKAAGYRPSYRHPKKAWFYGQLVFHGLIEPRGKHPMDKINVEGMFDLFKAARSGEEKPGFHAKSMYRLLKQWYDDSVNSGGRRKKRRVEELDEDARTTLSSNDTDDDDIYSSESDDDDQSDPDVSDEETPDSHSDGQSEPEVLNQTSQSSEKWEKEMESVQAFSKRQKVLAPTGSYIIKCPEIESKFPALECSLRMSIEELEEESNENGIYEGSFDFGIFKGTMAMARGVDDLVDYRWEETHVGNDRLNQVCRMLQANYAIEKPREEHGYTEFLRLKNPGYVEEGSEEELDGENMEISNDHDENGSSDQAKERKSTTLYFEHRSKDEKRLFMKAELVFADIGMLEFRGSDHLQFSGRMNFPMVSATPIKIDGFKTSHEIDACAPLVRWSSYPTSSVRYGKNWNKG